MTWGGEDLKSQKFESIKYEPKLNLQWDGNVQSQKLYMEGVWIFPSTKFIGGVKLKLALLSLCSSYFN